MKIVFVNEEQPLRGLLLSEETLKHNTPMYFSYENRISLYTLEANSILSSWTYSKGHSVVGRYAIRGTGIYAEQARYKIDFNSESEESRR